ncbi:hypothetical protein [uncultured Sphingomonas sp.]|uniref:hypothetical protein n=1 Tax=uncultured Sphingomonas sp. TaxID=158754 RepID=UPI0035CC6255
MTVGDDPNSVVLPIVEEALRLGKRVVDTEQVRVRTTSHEEQVTLCGELARETVTVEERLVVEKRLFVTEEIRLRRTASVTPVEVPATRPVMRAGIEREPMHNNQNGDLNG